MRVEARSSRQIPKCSLARHPRSCHDILLHALGSEAPDSKCNRLSLEQAARADREAWASLRRACAYGIAGRENVLPMDGASEPFTSLEVFQIGTQHSQPTQEATRDAETEKKLPAVVPDTGPDEDVCFLQSPKNRVRASSVDAATVVVSISFPLSTS